MDFDAEQRIKNVRISWDQGSLLKQVDVIGSRGRNWPITDGKAQVQLISSHAAAPGAVAAAPPHSPRGRNTNGGSEQPVRSMSPNKKHIKDPYTSLDLFESQKQKENRIDSLPPVVAPRASARPPQREMSELFAAGHEDYEPSPERGGSPRKEHRESVIAPKGTGVHPKFFTARVFDQHSDENGPAKYKSNPAKYNHFDIGDADDNDPLQFKSPPPGGVSGMVPMRPRTTKHQSQWGFEDFDTPVKVAQRPGRQHARTFDWNEEENEAAATPGKQRPTSSGRPDMNPNFEFQDDGPEVAGTKRYAAPKPRPDADTHFELRDEATPGSKRSGAAAKGASEGHKVQGLYQNNLYDDGYAESRSEGKAPLKTITNNAGRGKDFGSSWEMTDTSPATGKADNENKPISSNRAKHAKTVSSSWDTYDESPEQARRPATKLNKQGMQSHWSLGGDDE